MSPYCLVFFLLVFLHNIYTTVIPARGNHIDRYDYVHVYQQKSKYLEKAHVYSPVDDNNHTCQVCCSRLLSWLKLKSMHYYILHVLLHSKKKGILRNLPKTFRRCLKAFKCFQRPKKMVTKIYETLKGLARGYTIGTIFYETFNVSN